MVIINEEKCIGCGLCVKACPFSSITIKEGKAKVLPLCTSCGLCLSSCKFEAISSGESSIIDQADLPKEHRIWVFIQHSEGVIKSVAFELLGLARCLAAQTPAVITAVIPGGKPENFHDLIQYGADHVLVIQDCCEHNDDSCARAVAALAEQGHPDILLIGATVFGRSLAPRISCLLDTGLTADCTGLEVDPDTGLLVQTRPAFGGNLMASIICPKARPQMATVRPHVFPMPERSPERQGTITLSPLPEAAMPPLLDLLERLSNPSEALNIQDSEIVIAVGKGIGNAGNIEKTEALASRIGGVVAATRAVVDSGWLPYTQQVGQTGKTISPSLYIALGISGAIQHTVGIANVDCLIAVNSDPTAPIFDIADYGIIADCEDFLDHLLEVVVESSAVKTG